MAYNTGINQRVREQEFFNNTVAEDNSLTQTNLSLIANLRYVQTYLSSIVQNYLPVINPNFQGTLTSSTGGNINLTGNSYLNVPTITSATNFTQNPTINNNQISVIKIGEIKMFISSNAPSNFVKCDGSLYPISQYPNLYNIIKFTYGGSGSNFNVPNFTSAFPIGGNSQNSYGCSVSNFVSGNNSLGGINNYEPSSFFGGFSSSNAPPLLTKVPSHTHNIQDPGHVHGTFLYDSVQLGTPGVPPFPNVIIESSDIPQVTTQTATTGIVIQGSGVDIQLTDPISNLYGVNVSPPYVAVFYYICVN